MPGICGIFSKTQPDRNILDLKMMIQCMQHESFYNSGTYINEKLGVYAGWVSLKGSFSDCMPVVNETNDCILLFAGENFADQRTIDELKVRSSDCDSMNASYLMHLYEENAEKFVNGLNGQFHGILIDLKKNKIFLFNDRYGMMRVYYYEDNDGFIFSSEAKSLLKIRPASRRINYDSLGEFFGCNCVFENRTLFHDIYLLPGGSLWIVDGSSRIQKKHYFTPHVWENQPILDREQFYKRLKDRFATVLPRYIRSSGLIALSLTGGLDTRMILAWLKPQAGQLPCYTHGGIYRDSYDVKIARKVAAICQQQHHTIILDDNFLKDFPTLAEKSVYISDGNLELSGAASLYVNRLARDFTQIRLTGNHGSELFRSVGWIKASSPRGNLFHTDFLPLIQKSGGTLNSLKTGHPLTFSHFKEAPWHEYSRLAVEQSQLTLRTPYLDNDLVQLMYQAPPEVRRNKEISLRLIADGDPKLAAIMTDRGVGGKSNPLYSKMSRIYLEFLFKMDYYYNHGMPQWASRLDYVLKPLHIEKLFLGRHKYHHYRIWFRDEWSNYLRDILFDDRALNRPYLNKNIIKKMVTDHIKGIQNYTNEINMILTAELTQRLLIEQ